MNAEFGWSIAVIVFALLIGAVAIGLYIHWKDRENYTKDYQVIVWSVAIAAFALLIVGLGMMIWSISKRADVDVSKRALKEQQSQIKPAAVVSKISRPIQQQIATHERVEPIPYYVTTPVKAEIPYHVVTPARASPFSSVKIDAEQPEIFVEPSSTETIFTSAPTFVEPSSTETIFTSAPTFVEPSSTETTFTSAPTFVETSTISDTLPVATPTFIPTLDSETSFLTVPSSSSGRTETILVDESPYSSTLVDESPIGFTSGIPKAEDVRSLLGPTTSSYTSSGSTLLDEVRETFKIETPKTSTDRTLDPPRQFSMFDIPIRKTPSRVSPNLKSVRRVSNPVRVRNPSSERIRQARLARFG